jgi:AcrR family transcriptional regulator
VDHSEKKITERSAPFQKGRRGRQDEAIRNDQKVLDAAREVIASRGPDAPVSAIAERAGVGVASLYRRYGSKLELLQRLCVLAMEEAIAAAETGLADEDPWRGLTGYIGACIQFQSGALAPLAGRIPTTPEMRETAKRSFTLLERLVRRSPVRRGVTGIDVAYLIELFSRGQPRDSGPQAARLHQRLLVIALDGLRQDASTPLPGPRPSRAHYFDRWG